jgi:probable rRNA maturation factor
VVPALRGRPPSASRFRTNGLIRPPLPVEVHRLAELLVATLNDAGVPGPARVDLTLVDPDTIAVLNAEHLGGEGPTDVLSFPMDPFPDDAVSGDGWPDTSAEAAAEFDTAPLRMVGDVVIAPEVAAAQADDHAGSPADELALLVVHAGLHLVGHDHAEAEEAAAMVTKERALLAEWWGPLAADPWAAGAIETEHR